MFDFQNHIQDRRVVQLTGSNEEKDPIQVNQLLKEKLQVLKEQIQEILIKVRLKYSENEKTLKSARDKSTMGSKTSEIVGYYKCGAPYFKNALLQPAPFNSDYKRRRQANEFFPFDVPETKLWTMKHKAALLLGVKKQMIEHIKSQQSISISQVAPKTREKSALLKSISKGIEMKEMSLLDITNNLEKNFPKFQVDWEKIAFSDLDSAHSTMECLGMWSSYMRPDLKRDDWTSAENDQLLEAVEAFNYQNWESIANQLSGRSSLQSFIHFQVDFIRLYQTGEKWTAEEDEQLLITVQKFTKCGVIDWNKVAEIFKTRNKTQCYNRYKFSAKVNIRKGVFSKEEDQKILEFVEKYGEQFNKITPDLFPDRTSVQIRNHYNNALRHRGVINTWTTEEDLVLLDYVKNNETSCSWKAIAEILGTHCRVACRSRYMTIKKHLERNPNLEISQIPVKKKKCVALRKFVGTGGMIGKMMASLDDPIEMKEKPVRVSRKQPVTKQANLELMKPVQFSTDQIEEKRLFHTFKLAYNYPENQQDLRSSEDNNTSSAVLFKLLGVDKSHFKNPNKANFTLSMFQKIVDILNTDLSPELSKELIKLTQTQNVTFYLPPSYNTILGFRGISLKTHFYEEEKEVEKMKVKKLIYKDTNYEKALNDFKSRFFRLFYWPAMLAKLDVNDLPKICDTGIETKTEEEEYSAIDFVLELHAKNKIKIENRDEDERVVDITYGESSKRSAEEIESENKRFKK